MVVPRNRNRRSEQRDEPNNDIHAVFGYGSLISSESAARTSKSLVEATPFPCIIKGLERAWNKHSRKGMTAMGVQYAEGASCIGVLYLVSERELARFDRREMGYDRHEIPIEDVDLVDYLEEQQHYDDKGHDVFLSAVLGKGDNVRVWVYVPRKPLPPDEDHPIAQTYVDVILQGCLDIHEDFAREFIEDTKGWNPQELAVVTEDEGDDYETTDNDVSQSDLDIASDSDVISWVNDRDRPIYMRADPDYSRKEGPSIDRLLRRHRPEFYRRKRLHHKKVGNGGSSSSNAALPSTKMNGKSAAPAKNGQRRIDSMQMRHPDANY